MLSDGYNHGIFYDFDTALSHPDSVRRLHLSDYKRKEIPIGVTELSILEYIDFRDCYELDWEDVFLKLSKCKTLKEVNITNCCIKSMPKSIRKLTQIVRFSCVGDTCLCGIPAEIISLKSLEEIVLGGTFPVFPKQLLGLRSLKVLRFLPSGLGEIPSDIDKLQNLEALDIRKNNIPRFPETLINLSKLRSLYIVDNPVWEREAYINILRSKLPNCRIVNHYPDPPPPPPS